MYHLYFSHIYHFQSSFFPFCRFRLLCVVTFFQLEKLSLAFHIAYVFWQQILSVLVHLKLSLFCLHFLVQFLLKYYWFTIIVFFFKEYCFIGWRIWGCIYFFSAVHRKSFSVTRLPLFLIRSELPLALPFLGCTVFSPKSSSGSPPTFAHLYVVFST